MKKPVKHYIYKGNILNFIILTFTSLFQTAAMIIISLMLEKIMAIATAKDLDALYEQGIMFLVLLVPFFQEIFSITNLFMYPEKLLEVVGLVLAPLLIVEIFKLLKINGSDNN